MTGRYQHNHQGAFDRSTTRLGQTSRQGGFTLIELMVTIAVAAIILTLAIPSFTRLINESRIVTVTNDLLVDMALARTEAMRRGQRVTLCASNDQASCTGAPWSGGWIIFEDLDRDAVRDAGETILRVHERAPGNISITGNGNVATYVSYTQSGETRLTTLGAAFQAGTIRTCMPTTQPAQNARDIIIAFGGRARVVPQDLNGACPAP